MVKVHSSHYVIVAYRSIINIIRVFITGKRIDSYVFYGGTLSHGAVKECDIVAYLNFGILVHTKLLIQIAVNVEMRRGNSSRVFFIRASCYGKNVRNKENFFRVGNFEFVNVISL